MNNKDYSRTRLIQFLQQTLSKNKSNNIYFDLENEDTLFVNLRVQDGTTKIMLISSSRLRNDIFLGEAKLRDFNGITLFSNYIDSLLEKYKSKKGSSILDVHENFEDDTHFDFDSIKQD